MCIVLTREAFKKTLAYNMLIVSFKNQQQNHLFQPHFSYYDCFISLLPFFFSKTSGKGCLYIVFNSSPPILSWMHTSLGLLSQPSVRTFIVQVTNDLHVTKTNDQFSFFILISSININWQSGFLPSPWNILTLAGFQDYTGFSLTFPAAPFWFPFQILSHWPKINKKWYLLKFLH